MDGRTESNAASKLNTKKTISYKNRSTYLIMEGPDATLPDKPG